MSDIGALLEQLPPFGPYSFDDRATLAAAAMGAAMEASPDEGPGDQMGILARVVPGLVEQWQCPPLTKAEANEQGISLMQLTSWILSREAHPDSPVLRRIGIKGRIAFAAMEFGYWAERYPKAPPRVIVDALAVTMPSIIRAGETMTATMGHTEEAEVANLRRIFKPYASSLA